MRVKLVIALTKPNLSSKPRTLNLFIPLKFISTTINFLAINLEISRGG